MDTVPSLQEQINELRKRIIALDLRIPHKRHWTKKPPLTPEEIEQAKAQIMPILRNLPEYELVTAWKIAQRTLLLRRLGTGKVREHLERLVRKSILTKEGTGRSASYCINRSCEIQEDQEIERSPEDQAARHYILCLQRGVKPDTLPDTGKWQQCIKHLVNAYGVDPSTVEYVIAAFIASGKYPGLEDLLD